ncbi:MAG: 2-iminoacetate synthase ThiH [Verrucomicrobiia bacterium]
MMAADRLKSYASSDNARIRQFARLLEPTDRNGLLEMASLAQRLTLQHFGRAMRLFAPIYLSNECINNCKYCGFSRDNPILRVTLSPEEVEREARHLFDEGFRNVLLVAGEHPKFVSSGYLEEVIGRLRPFIPALSIEVGPMETDEYRPLVHAGLEGLVVYQETYDREAYAMLHTAGPKRDFDWRLACPERGYAAGFRRIGIGALFGLSEWRGEAIALACHLDRLLRTCWKAHLTVSLPRLRPAAGGYQPRFPFTDADFIRTICAFRIAFPEVGIVLSTRESAALREMVIPLGITMMSAGSHTEPGGYTGQGRENLHRTVRGRPVEAPEAAGCQVATSQFDVADERPAAEIAALLKNKGYEPVWKDWDQALGETIEERSVA